MNTVRKMFVVRNVYDVYQAKDLLLFLRLERRSVSQTKFMVLTFPPINIRKKKKLCAPVGN